MGVVKFDGGVRGAPVHVKNAPVHTVGMDPIAFIEPDDDPVARPAPDPGGGVLVYDAIGFRIADIVHDVIVDPDVSGLRDGDAVTGNVVHIRVPDGDIGVPWIVIHKGVIEVGTDVDPVELVRVVRGQRIDNDVVENESLPGGRDNHESRVPAGTARFRLVHIMDFHVPDAEMVEDSVILVPADVDAESRATHSLHGLDVPVFLVEEPDGRFVFLARIDDWEGALAIRPYGDWGAAGAGALRLKASRASHSTLEQYRIPGTEGPGIDFT
jgi:hypothetical protein